METIASNDLEGRKEAFFPQKTIIFDWYDGIVCGLVQFNDTEYWCIINLLAWDTRQSAKMYSLIVLTVQEQKELLKFFEGQEPSWPIWIPKRIASLDFDELMDKISETYIKRHSDYYVFLADDINKGIQTIKRIQNGPQYIRRDIESVVNMDEEEREYWYSLLSSRADE